MLRSCVLAAGVLAACGAANAAIITQWDFNGQSATTVPGGGTSPTPSIGAGTASLLASVTGSFSSGIANGGSSDPVTTSPPNFGWQTTTYPAQGAGSGTAGVRFDISTVGVLGPDLYAYFDVRHSNTSSRFVQVQYTTDGTTFTNAPGGLFEATAGGDTWYKLRQVNLGADPLVFNNANFGFRVVTVFDPGTPGSYSAASTTYAGTGTLRFDMVTLDTQPIPEPASAALLAAGAMLSRRRR